MHCRPQGPQATQGNLPPCNVCRYYYEGDMIAKVSGKKFVYRFVLDLKVVVGYSAAELKAQVEKCVQNG